MTLYYVFGEEQEVLVDRDDAARDNGPRGLNSRQKDYKILSAHLPARFAQTPQVQRARR
jgi:hypothetical protein